MRVIDNGCGIAPEDRKRIFEPFFSARQGGTGLGLFLSLNFVRRWGGDIRVESEPGRGSTFEIVLPALVRDMKTTASILLVDDDSAFRHVMSGELRAPGPSRCDRRLPARKRWRNWRGRSRRSCCSICACRGWMAWRL